MSYFAIVLAPLAWIGFGKMIDWAYSRQHAKDLAQRPAWDRLSPIP